MVLQTSIKLSTLDFVGACDTKAGYGAYLSTLIA